MEGEVEVQKSTLTQFDQLISRIIYQSHIQVDIYTEIATNPSIQNPTISNQMIAQWTLTSYKLESMMFHIILESL